MTPFDVSAHIATCLEEDKLDYAIGGALALTAYAIPRTTKDVDISVFLGPSDVVRVFDSLDRAGVMLDRANAQRAVARIGMFSARMGRTLVDVFVGDHPHFHAMRARRRQLAYPSGQRCWFVSPEDLCVLKLMYGRPKDVVDLERLFVAQPELDLAYVRTWVSQLPGAQQRLALLDDLTRRFRA